MARITRYPSNRVGPCASRRCVKGGTIIVGVSVYWQRSATRGRGIRWHVECVGPNGETTAETQTQMTPRAYTCSACLDKGWDHDDGKGCVGCDKHTDTYRRVESEIRQTSQQTTESEVIEQMPQQETQPKMDALAGFADMLAPYLDGKLNGKVDVAAFDAQLEELRKAIEERNERELRVITIRTEDGKGNSVVINGLQHRDMPKLIRLLQARKHTYLFGKPGSGKSTAAIKAAEILGLQWGYISLNPRTAPSLLMGFIGADAKTYMGTQFRKCYEFGGVFCIDELDNAGPDLLTSLNAALENGHCAFPDGMVARHPDFILVATGNTNGRGGNASFPERRALDAATLDRFFFVQWEYDEALERAIAKEINPACDGWVDWVLRVRTFCHEHYPKVFVTPRVSINGAGLLGTLTVEELAHGLIFKGVDRETVSRVLGAVPLPTVEVKS